MFWICPKSFWKHVNKNSLISWYVLKTYWRDLCKTSWKRLEDVFARHSEDIFKTSWRRLENVLKTSWWRITKTIILVLINTSWTRIEDVFWRRRRKTSSRRVQDVLIKTNVCWVSCSLYYQRVLFLSICWQKSSGFNAKVLSICWR